MRYTLTKALTGLTISENGRKSTPVLAYVLKDNVTGEVGVCSKHDAYKLVRDYGATNCVANFRFLDKDLNSFTGINYYLKLTDGTKINDYLLSVVDSEE